MSNIIQLIAATTMLSLFHIFTVLFEIIRINIPSNVYSLLYVKFWFQRLKIGR